MSSFGILLLVLGLLFSGGIALLGVYFTQRKMAANKDAYFTAGRNITTAFMTATFIAYAVGTGLVFSPGEMAYLSGLTAMIGYALAISLAYIVFIPISSRIKTLMPEGYTIGEYARVRYGKLMHAVTLAVTVIYMFILMSSNLIGAAIALKYIGGIPVMTAILVIGIPIILYSTYGGLGAAIFTNGIQSLLITPLLLIPALFALRKMGGAGALYDKILEVNPSFLEVFNKSGIEFAILIIIAVCSAELLNQALWQRVYSAKDQKIINKSLISSAIMTFPMTIVAASLGLVAVALKMDLPHTSIAPALVINTLVPQWMVVMFVLVVILAAASTAGDALSAFSSIFSIDIIKPIFPKLSSKSALVWARLSSILFGIFAMYIASFTPSILFLLLAADLLACATVVPLLVGLYKERVSGTAAAMGTLLGIVCGLPLYIYKVYFLSFVVALLTSSAFVLIAAYRSNYKYDLKRLSSEIKNLED